ncbi:MAG: hypothetical protein PHF44_02900 [Candidatus Pacebacteria bacterium]|nr:hypothetical protein [Candidatus Paceibacterota bacterium]
MKPVFFWGVIFVLVIILVLIFIPENPRISQFLPYIAIIPPMVSIYCQSESTEKMIETTSRPHICVGIISFKGDGLRDNLSKKYTDLYDRSLLDTRIIIKNFSNAQAFVWTKLNLEINNKEANEHIKIKDYCFGKATWELDPNELLFPYLLEESILDYKNQKINIGISVYFSHIRKLPKNPDWIELTAYSFREERQWIKNNLGVPFFIQGLSVKV